MFKDKLKKYDYLLIMLICALGFVFGFVSGIYCEKQGSIETTPAAPTTETTTEIEIATTAPAETTAAATTTAPVQVEELFEVVTDESGRKWESLGKFTLYGYDACVECCGKTDGITATGTKAKQGRTIAVDPSFIPYGAKVMINGHIYTAEDCGGNIKGNCIDIYFDTHTAANNFGKQTAEVFILV